MRRYGFRAVVVMGIGLYLMPLLLLMGPDEQTAQAPGSVSPAPAETATAARGDVVEQPLKMAHR